VDRTEALDPAGRLRSIVSFGRDAAGELYLVSQQGTIWKLVPGDGVAAAD
jgi:hypothetical protein